MAKTKKPQRVVRGWWWDSNEYDVHGAVFGVVRAMEEDQASRMSECLRFARLYANTNIRGLGQRSSSRSARGAWADRVTLNILKSVIDTAQSQVAKARPRVQFLTEGGNFGKRQEAKKLTRFNDGVSYETDFYKKSPLIFRDAEVWGTGVYHVYAGGECINEDRVFPWEVLVDDAEAQYGEPRQMHRWRRISRDVLEALVEEWHAGDNARKQAALRAIENATYQGGPLVSDINPRFEKTNVDMLYVVESWRLPSSPRAEDGRHCITVDSGTLLDEEWERHGFPFAFLHWGPRLTGFWGCGIAEDLAPLQADIHKTLVKVQKIMQRCSTARIVKRRSAGIPPEHITNDVADIIEVDDPTDLQVLAMNAVPSELWGHLEAQIRRAYELVGVTQLSASGNKPAGVDSGRALREYSDIESQRFAMQAQAYERFGVDVARLRIAAAKELAERPGEDGEARGYRVRVPDKRALEWIDWLDIKLKDEDYVLQPFPTSSLPRQPAARQATLSEWYTSGLIDREQYIRLADFPDLQEHTSIEVAANDDLEKTFDDIVERGRYMTPEPFQDLARGLKRCQSVYLRSRVEGVPEDRLEMLRRWMDEAAALQAKAMAAAAPPPAPGMPMPMPGGPPMPAANDVAPMPGAMPANGVLQ